jgi:glycerol-3-phosphate acyltransferase PlsY
MSAVLLLGILALSKFQGSVPVGIHITRRKTGEDQRETGRGKTCATNVMRSAVKKLGFVVQGLSGLAAMAGHNRPMFSRFRGGRGVSAFFGTMCVIHLPAALFGIEVLAIVALATRRMSLGSLLGGVATCSVMLALFVTGWVSLPHLLYAVVATGWLILKHRDNIGRLRNGTERRLF